MNLNYDLIAVDLPSHANSEKMDNLSLELYVDVVKKIVDSLNIGDIVLCGHSLGGAIVLSYYFKYPKDVAALILCATGARLRVIDFIFETLRNNYREYLEYLPLGNFFIKTSNTIKEALVKQVVDMDPEVVYADFKICNEFDVMDKLSSIIAPCLVICGNRDTLTPIKYSTYLKKSIKNSELVIINRAAHKVMLEKPDEVNSAIQEFIRKFL